MAEWRGCKLGDLLQIKHGFAFLGEYFSRTGTHIVLTPGNFLEEGGFKENSEKAKWYDGPIPSDYVLNKGDLLIAMTEQGEGLLGSSAIVPRSDFYLHNQRLGLVQIRDRTQVDQHFVYYLFNSKSVRQQIRGSASGAKIRHTAPSRIAEVKVRVPPLPIQRRIAGILSAYDELIENSRRRIQVLETVARALYREWFVHLRFPGHERVPRVASSLGDIPKGWEVKPLEAVCARITDGSHLSPPSVNEGYPMASVKDMHDWGINVESCRRVSAEDYADLVRNNCKPLKNDVLIAKDGSYLKHTFVVGKEQDLVVLSSIAILRPNSLIRPNYLSFTLREPTTKARMTGFVSGVAIPRIILKDFRKFQILVPPPSVQIAWTRHIDPKVELCRTLISQIQNLRRTRDLLLPRLLSGTASVH
jgi:type I restriction enzyme S subunit